MLFSFAKRVRRTGVESSINIEFRACDHVGDAVGLAGEIQRGSGIDSRKPLFTSVATFITSVVSPKYPMRVVAPELLVNVPVTVRVL